MKFFKLTTLALIAGLTVNGVKADEKIVIEGSSTVGPLSKAFAEYFMSKNNGVKINVGESGSGNGAKALAAGTCDVAALSRHLKSSEFNTLVEKKIEPIGHVIALDGIAVVVHPSNPVANLTAAQVLGIYTGKITNWKEVGGADQAIVVISRDTNSGTYEAFNELALNKEKITEKAEYVGSSGQAKARVTGTPAAIAYVGLGFTEGMKAVSIDGVAASAETVRAGSYKYSRPLFLYTNGYPKLGSTIYKFVTLHLSQDGQEMVEELGFVPVTNY